MADNLIDRVPEDTTGQYRRWFREAVDAAQEWRDAAQEDYDFVSGNQWSEAERKRLQANGRPALVINRIKPLVNVLSGYQRLNRYDIDFLPRTNDDAQICQVRKGLTKYILDQCDYDSEESQAFLDASIGGLGWFKVGYKFGDDGKDGEAFVKRADPFGVYPDPESHKPDYSDARYICEASWVDKDELIAAFPEHEAAIKNLCAEYDSAERMNDEHIDRLWYAAERHKVRLVECWHKKLVNQTVLVLADGSEVTEDTLSEADLQGLYLNGMIQGIRQQAVTKVIYASFVDRILLEEMDSPYQHGHLPLVPIVCYHFGAGDIPAGIVRDLKDPQREINKRRIQALHILNTTSNGGGWIEQDAMTPEQWREFERKGTTPGHFQKIIPGKISGIHERAVGQMPVAVVNAEAQATQDLPAISGINESLMGTDMPSSSSGRAIELKQKQAITHIAPLFDALRKTKKEIAYQLWGRTGKAGIVPQFYTEHKVYRIEGQNGQQFVEVNQQVLQQDPIAGIIVHTLNDLSQGEFDIVIADTQASTTQRQAQMWGLVDAVSKLGVPGDLVFDIIIDLSDIPNKDDIKQRFMQRQQEQAQAQQAQAQHEIELEEIKNRDFRQQISFKDAPLPLQLAMAAKAGYIDPTIAQYAINLMVQGMFPQLAEQMAQAQAQQAQQQQMAQMQQAQQAQTQGQPPQPPPPIAQPPPNNSGNAMTDAAAKSIMAGQAPAAL